MEEKPENYLPYYERSIKKHRRGLKLVVGGTGQGKTTIIPQLIRDVITDEQKAIYIANRHQLLEEMADNFNKAGENHKYLFLKRDLEVVSEAIRLPEFGQLLQDHKFRNLVKTIKRTGLDEMEKTVERLKQLQNAEASLQPIFGAQLEKEREALASRVLFYFRTIIKEVSNKQLREWLLDHKVIQVLFPFIAFKRRPEIKLLLITVQKAFHGFFDGERRINLGQLENFIIFLDEFDFLENELVSLICQSAQIDDIFQFVELYYNELSRHKLPFDNYFEPVNTKVSRWLIQVVKLLETLNRQGIQFPKINQFTIPVAGISNNNGSFKADASHQKAEQAKANLSLFRTSHIISTKPLFLRQTRRSFEIVDAKATDQEFRIEKLFNIVDEAAKRIITSLKALAVQDEILYREVIRQCFKNTIFSEQLDDLLYVQPRRSRRHYTQIDALIQKGYTLYDIRQLNQRTDPEEVQLQSFSMNITPDQIIANLAHKNLVFALSATADIQRCLHHFDLDWLRSQPDVNFIELDEVDREIIRELNAKKAAIRETKVSIYQLDTLDLADPLQKALADYIEVVASDERFGQGRDSKMEHRKQRVQHFFALLFMIINKPENVAGISHLVFLNSFRQIKFIFDTYNDESIFKVLKHTHNTLFEAYDLCLCEKTFTVVFYDAAQAKRVRNQAEAQASFDSLFQNSQPVIVITQYLSAGNGVNLQYTAFAGQAIKSDFLNLHLLEVPYFYFGNPEKVQTTSERTAIIKENLWYLAKLHTNKFISEARFRAILGSLHDPNRWNTEYQTDPNTVSDALLNNMATFIQAIGRIERTWQPTHHQTITLSRDVYECFWRFLIDYEEIWQAREEIISSNLKQIFDELQKQIPLKRRELRRRKDSKLPAVNLECQRQIRGLVIRLKKVREGSADSSIREEWQQLRRAVLRHDFQDRLVRQYCCVFNSPLLKKATLWLNAENEIVPGDIPQPGNKCWQLNSTYEVVGANRIINRYFMSRGYELAFNPGSKYFFTPYCYQAILLGAVGEEACQALLYHEKIKLEEVSDALYELVDLKVAGVPYYIDCKNYTDRTLEHFALEMDDPVWHPKLNEGHFKARAEEKLAQIEAYHKTSAKLIYLNLITSQERPLGYYDLSWQPVTHFAEAAFIVVQGCLQLENPNAYHDTFTTFIKDLQSELANQEKRQ